MIKIGELRSRAYISFSLYTCLVYTTQPLTHMRCIKEATHTHYRDTNTQAIQQGYGDTLVSTFRAAVNAA